MKLLRVKASNFKNCQDDFIIDFVAKSRKTSEDKEYELQEIADGLFVYNTIAIVGKNASGKTTAIELIECCYSILGNFRLENRHYDFENVRLEITFFYDSNIYCYRTVLHSDTTMGNKALFAEQQILFRKYFKSNINEIYDFDKYSLLEELGDLPEDTSDIFFVLKNRVTRALYFPCDGAGIDTYQLLFKAMKTYKISLDVLSDVLRVFDSNITELTMVDEHNYSLTYMGNVRILSDKELIYLLSSGTTRGMLLYVLMVASLKNGLDLVIDEVENHFHKTLVDNMISLYKDKSVNCKKATLIFSTHYFEVLDLFNRRDNIWISKSDKKVCLFNMYDDYDVRSELLKSRQFYNNTFDTAVNYEDLMRLKRKLMV